METIKDRIKSLCKKNHISMNKLEATLGLSKGYISKLNTSNPSADKLQAISSYFNVSLDYLMLGKDIENNCKHYIDKEVRELAEFLHKNPEYLILFDASRKVKKEDILFVKEFMDRIQGNYNNTEC